MSSIFISKRIPNGHTWTITSKLGHILSTAEEKYGKRDTSYTLLGVEFNQEMQPIIWYPGNKKHIVIQITLDCLDNINQAIFQVAHEVIHCLCPTGDSNANVLEEGLANLFSIEYTRENDNGIWEASEQKYTDASELVERLLSYDTDIIKKLRLIQPTISLIDENLILQMNPNIPSELANKLVAKF